MGDAVGKGRGLWAMSDDLWAMSQRRPDGKDERAPIAHRSQPIAHSRQPIPLRYNRAAIRRGVPRHGYVAG
jgi:hypothetical protein